MCKVGPHAGRVKKVNELVIASSQDHLIARKNEFLRH